MSVFGKKGSDNGNATLTEGADAGADIQAERTTLEQERAAIAAERQKVEAERAAIQAEREQAAAETLKRETALRQREVKADFDGLKDRVTTAQRGSLEQIALHLRANPFEIDGKNEDGEPAKVDAYAALMGALKAQPKVLETEELTDTKGKKPLSADASSVEDTQAAIRAIMEERKCSVEEAFALLTAEQTAE